MSSDLRVLVIGGGAAGFFGAIACAEAHPHAQVMLLEASRSLLAKVRISGGGRCNVTHACFDPALLIQHYPRGGKALRGAFSRFQPKDTIAWFQRRGVTLKTEADGRMFPISNDSATIVDCLMEAARTAGVMIKTGAPVAAIQRLDSQFVVQLKSGELLQGDRLLLATGSNAQGYQLATSLGHRVEPPVPSLFTFNIADAALRELAGVSVESVQARLVVPDAKPVEQSGAVLITHWGLSGPAILRLSAWGARLLHDHRYQVTLRVNWLPQLPFSKVEHLLGETKLHHSRKAIASYSPFALPRRLWQYLVERCEIDSDHRWADLSKKSIHQLVQALTQSQYAVTGKSTFKEEFVTCGGVALNEVNFKTMESRLCPGLHFAGEILDIDGITGGFNFQSAWTTGWLAGQAMGE